MKPQRIISIMLYGRYSSWSNVDRSTINFKSALCILSCCCPVSKKLKLEFCGTCVRNERQSYGLQDSKPKFCIMYTHTQIRLCKTANICVQWAICRDGRYRSHVVHVKMFPFSNGSEPFQKPFVNTISKVVMGKTYETAVNRILNDAELTERVRTE